MHNSAFVPPRLPTVSRNVLVAGSVLVLHAAALWALQSGLLRRAVEVIVPVEILSSMVTPPAPVMPTPPAPPAPQPEKPKPRPVVQRPRPAPTPARAPVPAPAPMPVATPSPAPAPQAPVGVSEPQPPAPPITAPMTAAPPAPAPVPAPPPPPPPVVQLPSTNADYLQNPPPDYPPLSRRLREEGKVLLHVQISADGAALDAQVKRSSGYDRLDRAALEAVRKWRYVPGKRGGVPETMWFDVPVDFVLNRSTRDTR